MARKVMAVLALVVAATVFAGPVWAKGYENKKSAGKYQVTLKTGSYPLVKGNNTLTVSVADKAGKPVTTAKVSVRYYMPAMPGMAPMSSTVQPVLKGQEYGFNADISMEGGWRVEVTVGDDSATFNLDAR